MATSSGHSGVEAEALLELAEQLQQHLKNNTSETGTSTTSDALSLLDKYLNRLPLVSAPSSITIRRQLAAHGVRLWNTSAHMVSAVENTSSLCKGMTPSRFVFKYLQDLTSCYSKGSQRALIAALRTARSCTEHGLFELSQEIIGIAAIRLDRLERSTDESDKLHILSVTAEYYMARVYLAWLQGRPDIADHLFTKIQTITIVHDQKRVVDLCYKIGISALNDCLYDDAAKWLERALSACELSSSDMTQLAKNDELLILHGSVQANLHLGSSAAKECLRKALCILESKYTNARAVKMLQLELFAREVPSKGKEFLQMLHDVLNALEPNEAELKILAFYIQKVRDLDINLYVHGLQQVLLDKLATSEQQEWTERILITLVWTLTNTCFHIQDRMSILCDTMKSLAGCGRGPLSEDVTNACSILIWKYIDVTLSKGDFYLAEQWCSFVLEEPMFQISLDNRMIFLKKLITCASYGSDACVAYTAFDTMPEECRRCPSALFLIYKAALDNKDFAKGHSYLESLCQLGTASRTYLLPCAAEALRSGQTLLAAKPLQHLIANLNDNFLEGKYIASLFIAIISLISAELQKGEKAKEEELLAQVISVFEAGRSLIRFSAIELEWFAQRSYNIAAQAHASCDSGRVVRLLDLSIQHYVHCDFIKIVRSTAEARTEREPSLKACPIMQQKYYENVQKSVQHCRVYIQHRPQIDGTPIQHEDSEWLRKNRIILSVDLECAILFNQWDRVSSIIEESKSIIDNQLGSVFLDCILRCKASVTYTAQAVEVIVLVLRTSTSPYLKTATTPTLIPRFIHILFQLSLNGSDYRIAESALDQALSVARDNCNPALRYPGEEIQWMATVAFNRAVDLYLMSDNEGCRRWAEKAIQLADFGGLECEALGKLLREKLGKLS
ncbi:meiosis protein SPO22/ZIP4 like-domain-containing protein [Aspergillus coremiiformis]|uniref:Meiosis protein SPO22/ZIP4 like-domain-containing protein n=1 Tax=Aspergillus coremiiformis TaxID=138285 RepID=A0A5N6Z4W6_9EURO|nr:meiosis protein SPO22/ZIP4 like-domain-containing protein [Aspergillus coremiiformis]